MTRTMTRTDFGKWGYNETMALYEAYRDERFQLMESGLNPNDLDADGIAQPFAEDLLEALNSGGLDALLEAAPDAKADFANFLWEPIQANFYKGYDNVAGQWDRYVDVVSVNSFDEVRIKGINGLTGIGYVGELGERPGMRRSFRPEAALVVDTYGGDYAMTRKLIRSNGAKALLDRVPTDMGDEMAVFITRLIISLIVANPTAPDGTAMYHASRGNTVTAALSEDTLVDAAVWLGTRVDPDGRPIQVTLRSAVVQNMRQSLRLRQIVNSQLVGHTENDPATTHFTRGTMNPIADAGIIPSDGIIVDPYFPDANDVYFFADPAKLPAFMVGFLDGKRRPSLFRKAPDAQHISQSSGSGDDPYQYEERTLQWGAEIDTGVSAVDPLGTYRLTPA